MAVFFRPHADRDSHVQVFRKRADKMGILAMSQGYPRRYRDTMSTSSGLRLDDFDKHLSTTHHNDDDDIDALREENAQLRDLVVRLSQIVARNALDRK